MNIPSAAEYIQVEATQTTSPVSESSAQAAGGSINFLLDSNTTNTAAIAALTSDVSDLSRLRLVSFTTVNTTGAFVLSTTSTQYALVQFFEATDGSASTNPALVTVSGLGTYSVRPVTTVSTPAQNIISPIFIGPSSSIIIGSGGLVQAVQMIFESVTGP